jgi:hypothetical protein
MPTLHSIKLGDGLQDEEKQNKNHNTTCIGHHNTQTLTLNKT